MIQCACMLAGTPALQEFFSYLDAFINYVAYLTSLGDHLIEIVKLATQLDTEL